MKLNNFHFFSWADFCYVWGVGWGVGGFFVGGHREAGDTPSVMKHIGGVTKCVCVCLW